MGFSELVHHQPPKRKRLEQEHYDDCSLKRILAELRILAL